MKRFLTIAASAACLAFAAVPARAAGPVVRPYAVTRGRTREQGPPIDLVAVVIGAAPSTADRRWLETEHLRLLARCRRPDRRLERLLAPGIRAGRSRRARRTAVPACRKRSLPYDRLIPPHGAPAR